MINMLGFLLDEIDIIKEQMGSVQKVKILTKSQKEILKIKKKKKESTFPEMKNALVGFLID